MPPSRENALQPECWRLLIFHSTRVKASLQRCQILHVYKSATLLPFCHKLWKAKSEASSTWSWSVTAFRTITKLLNAYRKQREWVEAFLVADQNMFIQRMQFCSWTCSSQDGFSISTISKDLFLSLRVTFTTSTKWNKKYYAANCKFSMKSRTGF